MSHVKIPAAQPRPEVRPKPAPTMTMSADNTWVLTRHADIWEADRDAETFASDRGSINIWGMTPIDPNVGGRPAWSSMDGERHKRSRALIARTFNPGSVRKLQEKFQRYATEVVGAALDKRVFNAVVDLGYKRPMEALGDIMGFPQEDRKRVFGYVDKFAAPVDPRITKSPEDAVESMMSLRAYAQDLEVVPA